MGFRRNRTIERQLATLFDVGTIGELTDGELLERFVTARGDSAELAFAALVERHGPLVLHTCRSIVRDEHEAEDAFQATFLVLVRKAGSLWTRDTLGPWLHQVAYRAARHARSASLRRHDVERKAAEMAAARGLAEPPRDDLNATIHEELARLPDRYRVPVLLCDLEGRTYEQAARYLNCPVGTVRSRLARARQRLRDRLARRGLDVPAGVVAAGGLRRSMRCAVPPSWIGDTTNAAVRLAAARPIAELVETSVVTVVRRTLRTFAMIKLKSIGLTLLAAGTLAGIGMGVLARDGLPAGGDDKVVAEPAAAHPDGGKRAEKSPDIRGNWVVVYIAGTAAGKRQGYVMPNLIVPISDQAMNLPYLTGKPNDPINFRGAMTYFQDTAHEALPENTFKGPGGMTATRVTPKWQPGAIDFLPAYGTNAEPTMRHGIYRLQGEILSICYDTSGNGRPQTFDDVKESETIIVLQREYSASFPKYKIGPPPAPPTTPTDPPTGPAGP